MRVIHSLAVRPQSQLRSAYEHFRLERQGDLVSPKTLEYYDYMLQPFLGWLEAEHPQRVGFEDLDVNLIRTYRAALASRPGPRGRLLSPKSVAEGHKSVLAFLRWAQREGYAVDQRCLELRRPRVPETEATVFHARQLQQILAACNPAYPQEELAVRILVGSGVRASELCGLAAVGPDGLPDLMLDSLERNRAELRVRWEAGAKGRKSRRIPITPKLAVHIKRYEARHRPGVDCPALLVNQRGHEFDRFGLDAMMDRLQRRVGFHVHAHAFRHTFATVATKM
ncbi:MAG TPA: tyrosine-type recombinase/integrase, partial [Candidatus Dormibacteraeota bacterium]